MALDDVDKLYRRGVDEIGGSAREARASWCDSGDDKRIASVISIGDNDAEMQAVEIAAMAHEHRRVVLRSENYVPPKIDDPCDPLAHLRSGPPPLGFGLHRIMPKELHHHSVHGATSEESHWPWVKRVKFQASPHVKQLITQLEEVVELLPQAVAVRRHFEIHLERSEED